MLINKHISTLANELFYARYSICALKLSSLCCKCYDKKVRYAAKADILAHFTLA